MPLIIPAQFAQLAQKLASGCIPEPHNFVQRPLQHTRARVDEAKYRNSLADYLTVINFTLLHTHGRNDAPVGTDRDGSHAIGRAVRIFFPQRVQALQTRRYATKFASVNTYTTRICLTLPVSFSHNFTVLSPLPEAINRPSELQSSE